MTTEEFRQFFLDQGWTTKPNTTCLYKGDRRIRIMNIAFRVEVRSPAGVIPVVWRMTRSGYIKQFQINPENGKLRKINKRKKVASHDKR